uniref:peptidylprolyl isomerase n=1 Tax=Aureoumbra lagunensis TaxID=44058 RepID=A0A7S3JX55_9STRA|mmetsp:Transcript_13874/g.18523  ORF Transcript_13874/g.18523 Transcript_13874/m.18523 type:complete len:517 (-) Transcript_13874:202-1752(-)
MPSQIHTEMKPLSLWEPKREIRRVLSSKISQSEVMDRHMSGQGEPLVVSGATANWPARQWTIENLAARYGSDQVIVNDKAPLCEWDEPEMQTLGLTLAEYASYARGETVKKLSTQRECKWYLNSWTPFAQHPEMLDEWTYPAFVQDDLKHDPNEKPPPPCVVDYSKVFLGVAGCTTRLHFDSLGTHAWLAQLQGQKQFILFAPQDAERLRLFDWEERAGNSHYQGMRRALDFTHGNLPDPIAYPNLRRAIPFVTILNPGDIILIPRGWWHFALCLDSCVTLMRNFANQTNASHFRSALTRANEANDRSKPTLLSNEACVACRSSRVKKKVKPCSRCRAVKYCSRECQKSHFVKHHKVVCQLLAQVVNSTELTTKTDSSLAKTELHPSQHLFDGFHHQHVHEKNSPSLTKTYAKTILRPGKGRFPPALDSMVTVHYETFLADGQKIDSSLDHNKPVDFFLGRASLAKGWRDAILTMLVGEKARVAVPPSAAYGVKGVPNKVPPNSALLFEVELLAIW